ncbi:MAG: sigma-54 dependent transcriptional regulator [Deltaproteobacteria bacterium]|nr:sigma-54 dependent transcriptional regulator [Deltaproteobacteria bacterium]MCL5880634.1 sigma-54 dependent transcriptional regulator [Deltaproteobacteria bacterium]MDA8305145.1 sigma-54 dependent transcriptional regulator [Deltaproteobacteria bacterium]
MKLILIIDDEESIRKSLEGILADEGYKVVSEGSGEAGLKAFNEMSPNAVLLDIWLPDRDGVDILDNMVKANKNIPVIMISGHSDIDTAIKTIRMGAYDFIEKPLSLDRVLITVENAVKYNSVSEKKTIIAGSLSGDFELIGESDSIKFLKEKILKAAQAEAPVLITGENGTGKEMVARALHLSSLRKEEPFIAINCAAIPEELIESEIFGYEKGAFTGANSKKKGKFELADGGTIFLDEIGDMSLRMQSKILRVLQDNKFQRVGGETEIEVDTRVIAATNKDLEKEIAAGRFRSDLFYRLNVIPFFIPPLRQRREDIPLLVNYFVKSFSKAQVLKIDERAMNVLKSYDWPGNVRELKNIIERFSIFNLQDKITEEDVLNELKIKNVQDGINKDNDKNAFEKYTGTGISSFKEAKEAFERVYLANKLKENDNNITKTAENIGMSRRNLQKRMALLGIHFLPKN